MSPEMHWRFVVAAYSVTAFCIVGLIAYVHFRMKVWQKRARDQGLDDA